MLRVAASNLARSFATPARSWLSHKHRGAIFANAMRSLLRDPVSVASEPRRVLGDLVFGWGNKDWSGDPEYLQACMKALLSTKAPVLECGSGLTTIVLGALAQKIGATIWSLEHLEEWRGRVKTCLAMFAIDSVNLASAPLVSYGTFDWYAPPLEAMPRKFGMVVCDGPPGSTRGGRYGLVPVMKERLIPGCKILLDDAMRDGEQGIATRWCRELPASCEPGGSSSQYFALTLGQ